MGGQLLSGGDVTVVAQHAIVLLCWAQARVVYRCASKIDGVKVASSAILRGRYVIRQFTQADHIVVAIGAGGLRAEEAQIMVKRAGLKRARCVAVPAIPVIGRGRFSRDGGRHMGINQRGAGKSIICVSRLSGRANTVTVIAALGGQDQFVVVEADWRIESVGGVAGLAIDPVRMGAGGRDRRPAACVDAIGIIVAGNTGQHRGDDQAVIEYAIETESRDAVAVSAIDLSRIDSCHHRMPHRWISNIVGGRYSMTGIATGSDNGGVGVIGVGAQETRCRVTANALGTGNRMGAGRVIGSRGRFADGCAAVVATGTSPGNTRVIKLAVRAKLEKTGGIVAVVALGAGRLMKLGFADCDYAVMTLAAGAKHFLVVDKGNHGKSQRGVAGLAPAGGGDMIQRLPRYLARPR